jgi:hypothetical protein
MIGQAPSWKNRSNLRVAATLYVWGAAAIALFAFQMTVSAWFRGTGIGIEGGQFVMRHGSTAFDPGPVLGLILYIAAWTGVLSMPGILLTVLLLLDRVGSTANLGDLLKDPELDAFRTGLFLAMTTLVAPVAVILASWF